MADLPIVVWMDLETTGFSSYTDRIIQFAAQATLLDPSFTLLSSWDVLVRPVPPKPVPAVVQTLCGITNDDLRRRGVPFQDAYRQFQQWLDTVVRTIVPVHRHRTAAAASSFVFVAHNGQAFDYRFLCRELQRITPDAYTIADTVTRLQRDAPGHITHLLDSLLIARALKLPVTSHKLNVLYQHVNAGREIENAHNALADVNAMRNVFTQLGLAETIQTALRPASSSAAHASVVSLIRASTADAFAHRVDTTPRKRPARKAPATRPAGSTTMRQRKSAAAKTDTETVPPPQPQPQRRNQTCAYLCCHACRRIFSPYFTHQCYHHPNHDDDNDGGSLQG